MKHFTDGNGKPWAFEESDTQERIDQVAQDRGVTLTAITDVEYDAITNPPPSLADAQAAKIDELESAYTAAMQASVEFTTAAGVTATFQADKVSQDLLLKATTGFGIYGETYPGFYWLSESNERVPFTLADLKGLYLAMLMQGGAAFQRLQDRKDAVRREGVTVEEVNTITW